jgi:hypothetical protein
MNWSLAKIVYRIVCGDGNHVAQFDEQLRLIGAADKHEAFEKAVTIGRQEEDTFRNHMEQLVQWQFVNVSELYRLNELLDGAEIYSRISEVDDATTYASFIHHKAEQIRSESSPTFLNLI